MTIESIKRCSGCGWEVYKSAWSSRKNDWLCISCMREYHPPWMTLILFDGSIHKLWNLEVGTYEAFSDVEEIEWCGWNVRSKQETIYRLVPRVKAVVYHMEYHGKAVCGRCVDYKFFDDGATCLAAACEVAAHPHRDESKIQAPPTKSRFAEWTMG